MPRATPFFIVTRHVEPCCSIEPAPVLLKVTARRRRRSRCPWCGSNGSVRQCKRESAPCSDACSRQRTTIEMIAVGGTACNRGALRQAGGSTGEEGEIRGFTVPNAGRGAPSAVSSRLPSRYTAEMTNGSAAEQQQAGLDQPAGHMTAAEHHRGRTARLGG